MHNYNLAVWAREVGQANDYDVYASLLYQTYPPITLSASPAAPQLINTPITLTASLNPSGLSWEYKFREGYTDANGWHWRDLTDYTTSTTYTWTPTAVHNYTLAVWARVIGHTNNYDVYSSCAYQTALPPVTLSTNPVAPQRIGQTITLTAAMDTRGIQMQYKYRAGYSDAQGWHWTDITDYTSSTTCNWIPTLAQNYTLVVWVRVLGDTANYDGYSSVTYQITP